MVRLSRDRPKEKLRKYPDLDGIDDLSAVGVGARGENYASSFIQRDEYSVRRDLPNRILRVVAEYVPKNFTLYKLRWIRGSKRSEG